MFGFGKRQPENRGVENSRPIVITDRTNEFLDPSAWVVKIPNYTREQSLRILGHDQIEVTQIARMDGEARDFISNRKHLSLSELSGEAILSIDPDKQASAIIYTRHPRAEVFYHYGVQKTDPSARGFEIYFPSEGHARDFLEKFSKHICRLDIGRKDFSI